MQLVSFFPTGNIWKENLWFSGGLERDQWHEMVMEFHWYNDREAFRTLYRRSCSQMFFKIILQYSQKNMWSSLFLIKLRYCRPTQVFSYETSIQMFSCEYCKIFKNSLFYKTPTMAPSAHTLYFSKRGIKCSCQNLLAFQKVYWKWKI